MSTPTDSTLAAPAPKSLTIRDRLQGEAFKAAVADALPRHLKPDRFIRVALTAITRTPALAECDQASFFQALLSLSQYGLEPDGRRAHLIPFKNTRRGVVECQLIIDWKGLSELVYRSGVVSTLHADVVREGDIFDYSMGVLKAHVPHFLRKDAAKPAAPGEVYAVYAVATMKDGSSKCEVMSEDQIEGIRNRSKAGQSGPWITDRVEMAKKTAFRRLSKWLPLSAELRDAVEHDDDAIDIQAKPVGTADAKSLSDMLAIGAGERPEGTEALT